MQNSTNAAIALAYDITEIPRFAWVPGAWAWLSLLILCLALLLIWQLIKRYQKRQKVSIDPFDLAIADLNVLANSLQNRKEFYSKLSLIMRRILSIAGLKDAFNLSLHELQQASLDSNRKVLLDISTFLQKLESSVYGREISSIENNLLLTEAISLLNQLKQEIQSLNKEQTK